MAVGCTALGGPRVGGQKVETLCDDVRGVLLYVVRDAGGNIVTMSSLGGGCPVVSPESKK